MPYPIDVNEGIEIYDIIYDSWCFIGSPITRDYFPGEEILEPWHLLSDNNEIVRSHEWLQSIGIELLVESQPFKCRIESSSPLPDINNPVWQNPRELGMYTVFCEPPESDDDRATCLLNYGLAIYLVNDVKLPTEMGLTNMAALFLTHNLTRYTGSAYPIIYDDHMEIDCVMG
jgi:hypothetical protein